MQRGLSVLCIALACLLAQPVRADIACLPEAARAAPAIGGTTSRIRFYQDASLSMKGYLATPTKVPAAPNHYKTVARDMAATLANTGLPVEQWIFAQSIKPYPAISPLDEKFYLEKDNNQQSRVDLVLDAALAERDSVTVLLTDLRLRPRTDLPGDITSVGNQLGRIVASGGAVALVGLVNPYKIAFTQKEVYDGLLPLFLVVAGPPKGVDLVLATLRRQILPGVPDADIHTAIYGLPRLRVNEPMGLRGNAIRQANPPLVAKALTRNQLVISDRSAEVVLSLAVGVLPNDPDLALAVTEVSGDHRFYSYAPAANSCHDAWQAARLSAEVATSLGDRDVKITVRAKPEQIEPQAVMALYSRIMPRTVRPSESVAGWIRSLATPGGDDGQHRLPAPDVLQLHDYLITALEKNLAGQALGTTLLIFKME